MSQSSASAPPAASGAAVRADTAAQDGLLWSIQPFDAVAPRELYAALRLRSEVFVVEQNCVYLDLDDNDQKCLLVMGYQRREHASDTASSAASANEPAADSSAATAASTSAASTPATSDHKLVATARLFAPRDSPYAGFACIGRVCTSPAARRSGCGRALLTRCVAECAARYSTDVFKSIFDFSR